MNATTVKRLAILIAVLSLVGGLGFFTQRFQVERVARSVIEEAERAEKKGNFIEAEQLYRQHCQVFPDDVKVQLKYVDVLLTVDKSPKRQAEAMQIYYGILRQTPGQEEVRRRLMQLKIDIGAFNSNSEGGVGDRVNGADLDLDILLKTSPNDGNLLFLRGRCYEEGNDAQTALSYYQKAIEQNASQRIEAYQRLSEDDRAKRAAQRIEAYQRCAVLLRDKLKQPKEADQAIDMMVQSDSKNYKVYLARGRYRLAGAKGESQKALLASAKDDFEKAKQLASGEPEVYLAMVEAAKESGPDETRRILEDGLKNASTAGALYEALAHIQARAGQVDKAIKTLEDGVKSVSESSRLRFSLADLAAQHGATGDDEHRVQYQRKLRLQIEELSKLGFTPLLVRYLSACYHYNNNDFFKARQDLLSLQGARGLTKPEFKAFKAAINVMLAECYRRLRDPEMERAANERAYSADPEGENAQVGWINNLVNDGDIEGAIKAYQALIKRASPKRAPQFRLQLAELLIERNVRRPESQRDWSEVKTLIDDAAKAAPESVEPVIHRAQLLLAQGTVDEARNVLEQARSRFPKNVELWKLWNAEATLLGQQGRVDEALSLLDQAETKLGDRVELRLQRARLWVMRGGPQVVTVLNDLANRARQAQHKNIEPFSKEDRRRLLGGLANELVRQKDLEGAKRLLSQLAEENPNDLDVRLTWLELAFEETASKDDKKYIQQKDDIKKYIQQIERIEGNEGVQGRYCQVQYLIWQVQRAGDKNAQDTLRTEAREKLNELILRRGDWSVIPLALARLGEQELNQDDLDEVRRKAKEESIVSSYLQAIKLGQRGPAVLRRAVTLLFKNGRDNDAFELLNSLPAGSQLVGDLEHQAALIAVENQDFQRAEQIARKAVNASPGDFQERIRLVTILQRSGRQDQAETELRKAVDLSKSDPDRWITLVRFMVLTKQAEKAEKAIEDAESNLPKPKAPLALAQCCEEVGRLYEGGNRDKALVVKMKKWYAEAKKWYGKAQEAAKPDDLPVQRLLAEFFLRTKQWSEAESQLDAILKHSGGAKTANRDAWARRAKAVALISSTDPAQVRKALTLFEPNNQPVVAGQEGKALENPEDLQVLARVLDAQRTPQHCQRAIEILESLVSKNFANLDDRFLLARLEEASGDWLQAREGYRELILRTENPRDMETLNRRLVYINQFASSLLKRRELGDNRELSELQGLVEKLKQIQPDAWNTLLLEVELNKAQNRLDKAAELIQAFANRSDLTPVIRQTLAELAERKLGQIELAKKLYLHPDLQDTPRGKLALAAFLGRTSSTKNALDICEPLWANPTEIAGVVATCLDALSAGKNVPDPAQLNRVSNWLVQALAKPENQGSKTMLLVGLGNLRELQRLYPEAEAQYKSAVAPSNGNGVAPSEVIANAYNNLAWLMALNDGKGSEALDPINRAIKLMGPLPEYLDTRGVAYLTAGNFRSAIEDLEKVVAAIPSPPKYFHLAQAYLGAKNKEKAKQNWELAKIKGWEQSGLHPLEQGAYQKVLTELGVQ